MYKKKKKCGRCGEFYYWEEITVESGYPCCSKCKKNHHDKDDMMDDYGWGKHKDKKDHGYDDWKDKKDKKDNKHDKHDRNEWIRELLGGKFDGRKVALFTEDGTHTIGTVDEVKKDFVKLVSTEEPCAPVNSGYYTYTKPVKVKSDKNQVLETFDKYFVRLDSIVGFGEPQDNGYGYPPCGGGGYPSVDADDFMDEE